MKKNYQKPALKMLVMKEEVMGLSIHEKIGDGQLGKESDFEESEDESIEHKSVWD